MTAVRAVVFDYFGTLTPTVRYILSPTEHAAMSAALGVDADALDRRWRASYHERSTGETGDVAATLRLLAEQLGGSPTDVGVAEAVRIRTHAYLRTAQPRRDARSVLASLRAKGLRLAVVSDCSLELVEAWPDLPLADAVDATVFSGLVGRRKPDPLLYRLACQRIDVSAEECLYVGDGGSGELTGAAAFGMRAVLLADEEWSIGQRYDGDDWSGESISRLADVPALLR